MSALGALLLVAAAIRLDGLMVVPRLTDETLEVVLGLRLVQEGGLPLVGYAPHIGSLFTYLVALAFLLVGPKVEAGRLVVLTAGVLTVIPTYLLGRDLGQVGGSVMRGRLVGTVAAFLLVFSGPHIATSSRIAYSNSLTPLFTMLGLWLAQRAITRRSDRDLMLAGAACGLALQTAVSALAVGPGLALAVLLPLLGQVRREGLAALRAGWPGIPAVLVASLAALLMVTNLVVYNVAFGARTVMTSENRIERYVGEDAWTFPAWGDRLLELLRSLALMLGSRTTEVETELWMLLSPYVVIGVGLALLGLWTARRRGVWMPLLVTVSIVVIVSLLNGRLEPIVPRLRHYVTLLPLGMVMMALGLVWLGETLSTSARLPSIGRWLGVAVLLATPIWLAVGSTVAFRAYEAERVSRVDKSNGPFLAVLQAVSESGPSTERLYLDEDLNDVLTMSGGRMLSHLRYAFLVTGQEFDTIDLDDDALPLSRRSNDSRRLIVRAESLPDVQRRYRLVPLSGEPGEGAPLRAFRAFRHDP